MKKMHIIMEIRMKIWGYLKKHKKGDENKLSSPFNVKWYLLARQNPLSDGFKHQNSGSNRDI
jgi:hypothetical protein